MSAWLTGFANGVIPEDTAIDTAIAVIDVSDADGDALTVEVFGNAQSATDKFKVEYNPTENRYELRIKATLERDGDDADPESNQLRLRASDGTNSVESPQIQINKSPSRLRLLIKPRY